MFRCPVISPLPLRPLILAVAFLLLSFSSCARVQSIRDARTIVAEADSLRNAGQSLSPFTFHLSPSKSDSTAIAEAAATLQHVHLLYPTAYAHANYYYGRILREAGNHPEAMLAFLRVVHSRTKDHEIIARAYSNIGTMCHRANEFTLSYDMYQASAAHFLLSGDSVSFYYALNNMAYEKAILADKYEVLSLLDSIENNCNNRNVLVKIEETRAEMYLRVEQYDSAIIYSVKLRELGDTDPTGLLIRAKAFSYLGVKDSAVYYAQQVVESTNSWFDLNNAYYILANEDESKSKEEVLQVAADRSDVQKLIEIRQGQLSQATQLLEQDLNRKPDLKWLLAVLVTLAVIGATLSMYIKRKRRKRQLISQQVDNLRQEQAALSSQTQHLKSVNIECEEQVKHNITLFCQKVLLNPNPQEVVAWGDYKQMRTIINENFFGLADKLEDLGLAEHEVRFCVLVLLRFNRKKSAEWMRLGVASIGGKKRDIAMKLGQTSAHLYDFLLSLALK